MNPTRNRNPMPEEILFDILTMLPVKSICRFRCVSKSWCSIISGPKFVAAHLARSRFRPKLLISFRYIDERQNKKYCTFYSIDYPEQDVNTQPLRPTSYSSTELSYFTLISPSPSGLICFSCPDGIKIGNPITGDFDVIPYPVSDPGLTLFFGFDPVEESRVILKLDLEADYDRSCVFDFVENCWHVSQPHPWMAGDKSAICVDGVIYFNAFAENFNFPEDDCLYAFDVRLKSFQMVECPPYSLDNRAFVDELLIEYKGRVAFIGDGDVRDTSVDEVSMWILDDPEKHIWSFKSFVVPWRENLMKDGISTDGLRSYLEDGRKVKLLGATHRGELLFATCPSRGSLYLFFYQIETNSLRRFIVDGLDRTPCGEIGFNFVMESLQTLKDLQRRRK